MAFSQTVQKSPKGKTPLGIGARPPEQQRFDQKHALPKTSAGLARSACLWLRGLLRAALDELFDDS